jgi:hypothetical protein
LDHHALGVHVIEPLLWDGGIGSVHCDIHPCEVAYRCDGLPEPLVGRVGKIVSSVVAIGAGVKDDGVMSAMAATPFVELAGAA